MHLLYLSIAFTLNSIANILLKIGADKGFRFEGLNPVTLVQQNLYFLLGICLFGLNVIFYFLALKKVPLSVAYPVMTIMSFVIINSFAYFFLKETINAWQVLGYFLIVGGLILVFYFNGKAIA